VADSFLSPGGNYAAVAEFCGVTASAGGGFADANTEFVRCVDAAAAAVRTKCGPVKVETGLTFVVKSATYAAVLPFRVAAIASVLNDLNYIANRNERGLPRGVFSNFFRLADEIGTGQLNLFEP